MKTLHSVVVFLSVLCALAHKSEQLNLPSWDQIISSSANATNGTINGPAAPQSPPSSPNGARMVLPGPIQHQQPQQHRREQRLEIDFIPKPIEGQLQQQAPPRVHASSPLTPEQEANLAANPSAATDGNNLIINPADIQFTVPDQPDSVGAQIIEQIRAQLGNKPISLGELNQKFVSFSANVPGVLINRTMVTNIEEQVLDHTNKTTRLVVARGGPSTGYTSTYASGQTGSYTTQYQPIISYPYNPASDSGAYHQMRDSDPYAKSTYTANTYDYSVPEQSQYQYQSQVNEAPPTNYNQQQATSYQQQTGYQQQQPQAPYQQQPVKESYQQPTPYQQKESQAYQTKESYNGQQQYGQNQPQQQPYGQQQTSYQQQAKESYQQQPQAPAPYQQQPVKESYQQPTPYQQKESQAYQTKESYNGQQQYGQNQPQQQPYGQQQAPYQQQQQQQQAQSYQQSTQSYQEQQQPAAYQSQYNGYQQVQQQAPSSYQQQQQPVKIVYVEVCSYPQQQSAYYGAPATPQMNYQSGQQQQNQYQAAAQKYQASSNQGYNQQQESSPSPYGTEVVQGLSTIGGEIGGTVGDAGKSAAEGTKAAAEGNEIAQAKLAEIYQLQLQMEALKRELEGRSSIQLPLMSLYHQAAATGGNYGGNNYGANNYAPPPPPTQSTYSSYSSGPAPKQYGGGMAASTSSGNYGGGGSSKTIVTNGPTGYSTTTLTNKEEYTTTKLENAPKVHSSYSSTSTNYSQPPPKQQPYNGYNNVQQQGSYKAVSPSSYEAPKNAPSYNTQPQQYASSPSPPQKLKIASIVSEEKLTINQGYPQQPAKSESYAGGNYVRGTKH